MNNTSFAGIIKHMTPPAQNRGVTFIEFDVEVRTIHAGVAKFTIWHCNLHGLQADVMKIKTNVGDMVTVFGVAYADHGALCVDVTSWYSTPLVAGDHVIEDEDDFDPLEHLPF